MTRKYNLESIFAQAMGQCGLGERADTRLPDAACAHIAMPTTCTTDTAEEDAMLRALAVYASIVKHAMSGGTTVLVAVDGSKRTLKVRLK